MASRTRSISIQNAKWHDGVDITADDVQFSFDALANPDVG